MINTIALAYQADVLVNGYDSQIPQHRKKIGGSGDYIMIVPRRTS
jgi:hypothetical protein